MPPSSSLPGATAPAAPVHIGRRRRDDVHERAAERPIASALPLDREHVLSINESHERCAALGLSRIGTPDYSPVGRADFTITRERNRRLFTHAAPVMELLFEQVAKTDSMVVLTDSQGTILHSIGDEEFAERAGKVALAPGVNWAECTRGTNGIGTALVNERSMLVHADEHFMHANHFLTCQASPILDPRGNILGVLDITGDRRGYHQHTMGLVKMSARMIENHWLNDDFSDALRLHFHARLEFIGTLMEGILAIDADGRILGANRSALDVLGLSGAALRMHTVDSLLGTPMGAIAGRGRALATAPMRMSLPNGNPVYVQVRCNWPLWQGQWVKSGVLEADAEPAAETPAAEGIDEPETEAPAAAAASALAAAAGDEPTPHQPGFARLMTGDAQIAAVVAKLKRVLNRDIAVLVLGEAGSGKEMLARAIHAESRRASEPFVAVQCASTSEAVLEAELFGYAEGMFSGTRRKGAPGKLVQATGGTLFLDEVGGLPAGLQARLLRALQERRVTPLGAQQSLPIDVALVSATDRNPRELIDTHAIREDLYYRLNGLAVRLPPLRERTDLMALVRRMLGDESPSRAPVLAPDVEQLLLQYDWPGNLRQLASVLHTAAVMAHGEPRITREHLADDFLEEARQRHAALAAAAPVAAPEPSLEGRTLDELGRDAIRRAVDAAGGNISVASKRLGISRNTIYRKLRW
ncbi:MAG TPA: sigma-54-dependent Fis family transcriptional regulator [Methylibium sp.]|uniref:sigma-54-dependent Fis family transcriptional regulator n=1 Tax=Methylibium sp. TaxID=2067992 RepID=UPI002DB88194|nr:sigma-54-dependent Fis family transcriptional regulator [Methylibium sp.]HEU4459376.1 sigma-54-dependent Fis family transcriptional regulator [Methylibium sp.]